VVDNLYRQRDVPAWLRSHPRIRFLHADVRDATAVRAFLPADLTHVVDLAAVAGVMTVVGNAVAATRSNLLGSLAVMEMAESFGGLEHFVYFSSSEVYGPAAVRVAEDDVRPAVHVEEARWTYAVAKLAAESLLLQLWRERGLPATVVRPFNVYGPGQLGESAVHTFSRAALSGAPLQVRGSGAQRRAWCYVDDFLDGILLLLDRRPLGRVFNVGNPDAVCTVRELAEAVRTAAGSCAPIEDVPLACEDVLDRVPDISRMAALGFAPRVGLGAGLARTVAWYRSLPHAAAETQPAG
jgi:nucleoside-diphosphate-sugar epimerase